MGKAFSTKDLESREPKVVGDFVEPIREDKLDKGFGKRKDKNRLKEVSQLYRRKK